ncbi:MAG: hypothetical protein WBP61_05640 [Nocardioides sp.]
MRTRLLATTAALLALASGCGQERVATSDPGTTLPDATAGVTRSTSPTTNPTAQPASRLDPADVARAFRAFARGGDPPPVTDQVDLYLGNAFTGFVARQRAGQRAAWATCTETGGYAGHTCPLSPLVALRHHGDVAYAERPQGSCLPTYGPLPPGLTKLDRVVIVPADGSTQTCAQNFAVQLFVEDGRLVAVSTLLGEP